MYHRIGGDAFDPWGLVVTPARFAEQLDWLSKKRTVLPLTEFAARHRDRTLPREAVALTFDDGYECSAEVAAPMLEQAELPATIFIPAELIQSARPFWWDELQHLILSTDREAVELCGENIHLGAKHPNDSRWAPGAPPVTPRQVAFHRVWKELGDMPPTKVEAAMEILRGSLSVSPPSSPKPMSVDQVRETASRGVEFGSHALTHPRLPTLGQAEKVREIRESVDRCTALCGTRPLAFAYPFGDFDAECEQLVAEAGFACACTTVAEPVAPGSRPFALPRIQVGDWDRATLAALIGTL